MATALRYSTRNHTKTDNRRRTMEHLDYYADRKFCAHCQTYVTYLMSVDKSFCVQCGNEVRLFSQEDWQAFNRSLEDRRPKGGRPRKNQPNTQQKKESA